MTEESTPQAGLRRRIVEPSPPAPVPRSEAPEYGPKQADRSTLIDEPQQVPATSAGTSEVGDSTAGTTAGTAAAGTAAAGTASAVAVAGNSDVSATSAGTSGNQPERKETSDEQVVRSTGSMAVATLLSRITGFIRTVLIGSMLGPAIGSAFQTANTLPNLITEIVLGSVLTSLVIPVLTRAAKEDPDKGAAFIRRLFTLTITLLTVVTIVATLAAPFLTRLQLDSEGQVNVALSTSFAYLLLPQIFFYGLFSLFMAILNTKEIFRPGAWAPVANNIVSITVLILYSLVPGALDPQEAAGVLDPHVVLLGLGSTLGVVVQCAIMIPPLRKAGIDLRPLWGIDDRLKQFGGMAVAIVVYVAISQLGYIVTTRIASASDAGAPLIYSNAWLLLQVPYGVIGVTLLTAIMPRLSRNAAHGDDKAVVNDLTLATKLTFIALIPVIVFFTGFGPAIAQALFQWGAFTNEDAELLGLTLSFSAFTLIPYSLVMLHLRVFYAREMAWTPTYIIAGITLVKIVLSMASPLVATSPANVVILLGAANGFGFLAGAVIGATLLRRKLGNLGFHTIMGTTLWALGASLAGLAVALVVNFLLPTPSNALGQIIILGLVGILFVVITGLVLSRSGLPEVQNLGRMFARIPGMNRVIRPDEDKALNVGEVSERDLSQLLAAQDSFNATPIPPPMSAGVVRGPRLVPGAPVSDGRFRLLADCGSTHGAQFWKAREQATGDDVALVFVDTTGQAPMAARTPAESGKLAAEIARRTRRLADLNSPAVASGIRILSYRTGCLIVADWVEGSSLRDVAANVNLNPRAVAAALAPLADAAADAHDNATALGTDNSSRIRIDLNGHAVLAFPAVLPDASSETDASGLASAISLLAEAVTEDDQVLSQIGYDARAIANDEEESTPRVRDIARRLREHASSANATVPVTDIEVTEEDTPTQDTGFGSRGFSNKGLATLAGSVIVLVLLTAAGTTLLTSFISGDSETAPVNQESIQGSQTEAPRALPILVSPTQAAIWQAPGQDPAADNPDQVPALIDDDRETSWTSSPYPDGLGTKPGIGIALQLEQPMDIRQIRLLGSDAGARYSVYALNKPLEEIADISELPRITSGTTSSGHTIDLETEELNNASSFILWFSELPEEAEQLEFTEIKVVGTKE